MYGCDGCAPKRQFRPPKSLPKRPVLVRPKGPRRISKSSQNSLGKKSSGKVSTIVEKVKHDKMMCDAGRPLKAKK